MTELEALAKDCIENHTHRLIDNPSKQDIYTREESIYISGYKECERQNKNKIAELEAKNELLEGRTKEFEVQIMGLLIKYEEIYKRFPDLKEAYKTVEQVHNEIAELKATQDRLVERLNEAKYLVDTFLDFESSAQEIGLCISDDIRERADKFLCNYPVKSDNLTKAKKIYVLKKWKVTDLVGYWVNDGITAEMGAAESYLEGDRENRDYDEYDLDVSDLSYNQIFGERK